MFLAVVPTNSGASEGNVYCPPLRVQQRDPATQFPTLGSILENYIDLVNEELAKTIVSSGLGENQKEVALRQLLLAIRNAKNYYGYKGILTHFETNLTAKRKEVFGELSKMLEEIKKGETELDAFKKLEEDAIAFIKSHFEYYPDQSKVIKVDPYIKFSPHEPKVATLRIEGKFYNEQGMLPTLEFPNKSKYMPVEGTDVATGFVEFKVNLDDFFLDTTHMKNSYAIATFTCPWMHGRFFFKTKVEPNFEIVLATFPPRAGRISYVVQRTLTQKEPPQPKELSLTERIFRRRDVKSMNNQAVVSQTTNVSRKVDLYWNEATEIFANEGESIINVQYVSAVDQTFSSDSFPSYLEFQENIKNKQYTLNASFPFIKV